MRSSDSSVLRWPGKDEVLRAVRAWAEELSSRRPEIGAVGYFGSYARGGHGVGSDVDLVIVVEQSEDDFIHRGARFDTASLPIPADLLVYTRDEWSRMRAERRGPASQQVVWVLGPGETRTQT
jgi:uncharacterized protein